LDPTVSETFFGYVVAIYSLGSCLASPVFGYWSNRIKQIRIPTIFGLNMMLLGNLVYLIIDILPTGHRYGMAASRILIGIGSSNAVLLRAYASTASISADRSRSIGCVAAGIAAGLVIGPEPSIPGLQALFTPLGEDGIQLLFGWSLDMYKAPALLASIVNICGILLMSFVFEESYAGLKEDKEAKELPPADLIAVAVCIVTRFTQLSVSTNIETLGSAYSMLMFDFSATDAVRVNATSQAVQGVAAAIILLPFLFLDIGKRLRQRTVNIACLLGFIAFHLITYPWGFLKEGYVTKGFCNDMDKSKLRVVLEYEFRRGSTAAQAVRNITVVFGEDAPNERTVRRWFAKFESGDFDLQNESRGRPECKLNNDELKAVVEADPTCKVLEN
ncbi:hypothetical protein COOONC_19220, partial [Cooperia oncophora]